jgi:hypothetical protein
MEERLEAPSIVSKPLSASADPHGLSAMHTRRLSTPDRTIRHAFPVTFERDACAPLRSGAGRYPGTSATRSSRLAARGLAAPRCPSVVEMGCCPPRQRIEQFATGCLALLRPALRQYAEHEARCFRPTSASHLLSTTSTRAAFVPSISSRLAPRPLARACTLTTETGGPGGSQRRIHFGGRSRVRARSFLPCAPDTNRASDTPVAGPWLPPRLREA